MFVVTIDQVGSRRRADLIPGLRSVPGAESALAGFERTAGDEAQAVFDDAGAALRCAVSLAASGDWHCGVGQGPIEGDVPADPREGRGPAFVRAREAVERAKTERSHLAWQGPAGEGAGVDLSAGIDAALGLIARVRGKHRDTGRQAYDLALAGLTQRQIADELGISQQAVSERLSSALYPELERVVASCIRTAQGIEDGTLPSADREATS